MMRRAAALLVSASAACGAKTGLPVPPPCPDGVDYCFEIPRLEPPPKTSAILSATPTIKSLDLVVVMDTTGSMQMAIENLRANLSTSIFPRLRTAIPDLGIAIVEHRDYPLSPYGEAGIEPVRVVQTVTTDLPRAQAAIAGLNAISGSDGQEAQLPAMFHTLTGGSLVWPGGSIPAHTPAPDTRGGVDLRRGRLPVLVLVTDVDWHGVGHVPYSFPAPDMPEVKSAFHDVGARFVDITAEGNEAQAEELSDATESNLPPASFGSTCAGGCCTGLRGGARPARSDGRCRLDFLHDGGTGVSDGLIAAIEALSVGSTFDVTAIVSNDPSNPPGIDATRFVRALRAMSEGNPAEGCAPHAAVDRNGDGIADTFPGLTVGTPACFEILVRKPDPLPSVSEPLAVFIDIVGVPGNVLLDRKRAAFVVR